MAKDTTEVKMAAFLHKARAWLRRLLSKSHTVADPTNKYSNYRKTDVVNREEQGAFFYLTHVLDQLDLCNNLLRRLKKSDAEAYAYHCRVGAKIVPKRSMVMFNRLSDYFHAKRPGADMSMLFDGTSEEAAIQADDNLPALVYFKKIKQPWYVQRTNGDVYQCMKVCFLRKMPFFTMFHVSVNDHGSVMLLKERLTRYKKLPRDWFSRVEWGYPETLQFLYMANKHKVEAKNIEEYGETVFTIVANYCVLPAHDELMVLCRKNDVTVSLNVSTKRTPYFFKDRDTTVAKDGRRKRIFHIVREHTRELADGRMSRVKSHYRGERSFQWNGHDVVIALPKWQSAIDVPIAAEMMDEEAPRVPGHLTMAEVGTQITHLLTTGEWRRF